MFFLTAKRNLKLNTNGLEVDPWDFESCRFSSRFERLLRLCRWDTYSIDFSLFSDDVSTHHWRLHACLIKHLFLLPPKRLGESHLVFMRIMETFVTFMKMGELLFPMVPDLLK
jgi:hypothetical protein